MPIKVQLLRNGSEIHRELQSLLAAARHSICMIMYIFKNDTSGHSILDLLVTAARGGLRVNLIIDGFGSSGTPDGFFTPLKEAGGEIARFNTRWHPRYLYRNHQKLIIVDRSTVLLGGFNIGDEYLADGVTSGWREIGVRADGDAVHDLQSYFDRLWNALATGELQLRALRREVEQNFRDSGGAEWIISGPGIGKNRYGRLLRRDLARSSQLSLLMGYFVPTANLRRLIGRVARRGSAVLVLPLLTDVPIARAASWFTFRRLLRDGCQIYQYRPRPLHAKLLVLDDIVYAGSMNMDVRSFHLNFELGLRVRDAELAAKARELIQGDIGLSSRVTQELYQHQSDFLRRISWRLAYFAVSRLDYLFTRKFLDR